MSENRKEIVLSCDDNTKGFARMERVLYSEKTGTDLYAEILSPWDSWGGKDARFPAVVFVQGSAWTFPNIYNEIPQLSAIARQGYVVATIEHRSSLNGAAWPAYLEDTKTAIRFLRANAERFRIDPERIAVWGTSSGGNTALLIGLTGNMPGFRTEEYAEQPDQVRAVVDCFGPSDLPAMLGGMMSDPPAEQEEAGAIFRGLAGNNDPAEVLRAMSPVCYVKDGAEYPPFLLLHGDADPVVPFDQMIRMRDRLAQAGADVRTVRVTGGVHEGNFWSEPLYDLIVSFLKERL